MLWACRDPFPYPARWTSQLVCGPVVMNRRGEKPGEFWVILGNRIGGVAQLRQQTNLNGEARMMSFYPY